MTLTERAKELAAGAGIVAIAAAIAWANYQDIDPNAMPAQQMQSEQYRCGEWIAEGGEKKHGCKKMKPVEIAAGVAAGIVLRDCGTIAERGEKCPDLFPPQERCALCPDGLCRYGRRGEDKCDPDTVGCVPWPCVVIAGDDPEQVALEVSE